MQTPQPRFSVTPDVLRAHRTAEKREAAARFINSSVLGASVPVHSDTAFTASLADGTLLCHLLNSLRPGTVPQVPDSGAVEQFLVAVQQFSSETFSAADLRTEGDHLTTARVVECVLSLQDWQRHTGQLQRPFPPQSTGEGVASTPLPSRPPTNQQEKSSPQAASSPAFSFTPAATSLVARHASGGISAQGSDGLDYLLQSCTHMLKTKMGVPASPLPAPPSAAAAATHPEIALDAVGPVLESVLANLTTEYEKRLLAKDQSHKQKNGEVESLKRKVGELEKEAEKWRVAAESGAAVAAAVAAEESEALKAQERAEYERLRTAEATLLCELAAKRRELEAAEAAASRSQAQADEELAALHEAVERYKAMESRYKTVRAENQQLYNLVQDLRGSIRVFCRVRPRGATGDASESVVEAGEDGAVAAFSAKHGKWNEFKFDRVFGEKSTQEEVYQETKPLVRSVLDGYNVCIFAYGQTGSGKTHTMAGSQRDGVNFRALDDLFEQRGEREGEIDYTVRLQLVEIYNESIRDLLAPNGRGGLELNATRGSGSNLPDATQVEVGSAAEVAEVLARGEQARATAETKMNARSSRSHQVLTVMVRGTSALSGTATKGVLHLIDLAGSERVSRSGAEGQQLTEAKSINKSLTALGCVMQALAQKRDHIPFRDSKLTSLLADSLGGGAKSMMFMHVAPEASSASETLSTLNFGRGVTEITLGAAKRNVEVSASGAAAAWEARGKVAAAEAAAVEARGRAAAVEAAAAEAQGRVAAAEAAAEEARKAEEEERAARKRAEEEAAALRAKLQQLESANAESSAAQLKPSVSMIPAHRPAGQSATSPLLDRSSSGLAPPPQVGRLNLGIVGEKLASTPDSHGQRALASARTLSGTKIPTPLSRRGSFTARGATASPLEQKSRLSTAHSLAAADGDFFGTEEVRGSMAAAAAQGMLPRSRSGLLSRGSGSIAEPETTPKLAASKRWM